ncbi:YdcF family protein [Neobacillus piezotolerans]|uniref:YdcF family protein n=1 Tax=Neobacillus piezotolerans TaxID=2259171 RepID=A0A3D8GTK9_9BACI|nr:YdcF family protein [Neobacillus piezotolerans]RDU37804.1 YdcF family protein [Neobacillus piezotolerans]
MFLSKLDAGTLTDSQLTNVLFGGIEDDGERGDCIFVAGSNKAVQYRLPKAVQLYNEGRAGKILFSGGVTWPGTDFPEAIMLKNEALALGVPEEDILVEDQSLHTKENVLASLVTLDRTFYLHKINRLLVVTTAYHMRRMHLTLKTYMPPWIGYTLCPVKDNNTNDDNWFLSDIGRNRVETEAQKLIHYVKLGVLNDENVDL